MISYVKSEGQARSIRRATLDLCLCVNMIQDKKYSKYCNIIITHLTLCYVISIINICCIK